MSGYLIAAGSPAKLESVRPQLAAAALAEDWVLTLETSVVLVFCAAKMKIAQIEGDCGLILGDAFQRHGPVGADVPSMLPSSHASSPEFFSRSLWGNFIAILLDPARGSTTIQRSPFGRLGSYFSTQQSLVLVSSEPAALLRLAPEAASIHWDSLARQLIWDDLCDRQTCLETVQDLRGGESLRIDSNGALQTRKDWDPWCWQQPEHEITDFDLARELVGREVDRCIGAYAYGPTCDIVDLSGGFDSSLIASLLHECGRELCAFTVFSGSADGDERRYARLFAERCGIKLIESSPYAARVDVTRSAAKGMARPYTRAFVQEVDRLRLQAADEVNASRFFNGGGGDNVFCHLQSSAPAADALLAHGFGPKFLRAVLDVSVSAETSIWDVAWKAVRKAYRSPAGRPWPANRTFLGRARVEHLAFTNDPPWRSAPQGVRPGHVEHVQNLAVASFNANGFERSDRLSCILPLLAQPLAEACLRVPSWVWIAGARNRAVARAAARALLPPEVADRRSKGGLGDFQYAIFEQHRATIRAMLLEGELAAHDILDKDAVDKEFAGPGSLSASSYARLLRLCDAEAWVSSWR